MSIKNMTIKCDPNDEQKALDYYHLFGWRCVTRQEVLSQRQEYDGSQSVTYQNHSYGMVYTHVATTNYISILLEKDTNWPNETRLDEIEKETNDLFAQYQKIAQTITPLGASATVVPCILLLLPLVGGIVLASVPKTTTLGKVMAAVLIIAAVVGYFFVVFIHKKNKETIESRKPEAEKKIKELEAKNDELIGEARKLSDAIVSYLATGSTKNSDSETPKKTEVSDVESLEKYKEMLDKGLISQEDYDKVKSKMLGL